MEPKLFETGKVRKKKPPRKNEAELAARWKIAGAIVAAVPGESMESKADRKRICGYAKMAYDAGARSATDIERAVAARRRVFKNVPITAASIGRHFGDYHAHVRAGTVTESDYQAAHAADKRQRNQANAEFKHLDAERDAMIASIPEARLPEVLALARQQGYRNPAIPPNWRNNPAWRTYVAAAWKELNAKVEF